MLDNIASDFTHSLHTSTVPLFKNVSRWPIAFALLSLVICITLCPVTADGVAAKPTAPSGPRPVSQADPNRFEARR